MSGNFEGKFRPQLPDTEDSELVLPEAGKEEVSNDLSPKQRLFMAACNERLDELVELKMLPSHFAEERRKAAALIEEGLSDNPEEQGQEYAEIGTESIGQLKVQVEGLEEQIDSRVQPYLEMAGSLANRLEQENQQPEKVATIRNLIKRIQSGLDDFSEKAERVKNLKIPISDLNSQIIEVEKFLEETKE